MQIEFANAGKPQKLIQQILESHTLLANQIDLRQRSSIPLVLRIRKVLAEQIHVHPNHGQRILDSCASDPASSANSL